MLSLRDDAVPHLISMNREVRAETGEGGQMWKVAPTVRLNTHSVGVSIFLTSTMSLLFGSLSRPFEIILLDVQLALTDSQEIEAMILRQ